MGLFQWAVETYDRFESLAGETTAGKQPFPPVAHIVTNATLEVTLDAAGGFVSATAVDKEDRKTIIPVTEESAGRTSGASAHPLCEQIGYLLPQNEKKYGMYIAQLEEWRDSGHSHPKLDPILAYVKAGSIQQDLSRAGLISIDQEGRVKEEKDLVRWRVVGQGAEVEACWRDRSLFLAWIDHYLEATSGAASALCMITGENSVLANQHPKGVVPFNGNAKLISANDARGFTYRGRFTDDAQAVTVSYLASQKAHSALRWLVADQGVTIGGRTYVCWCPQGKELPRCTLQLRRRGIAQRPSIRPSDFRRELWEALASWKNSLPSLERHDAVIVSFDAATTGRLAVAYYNELAASDFLDRLYDWDLSCAWFYWDGEKDVADSPSLRQIAELAYGTERGGFVEAEDRVLGEQVQRLVRCRIERAPFPVNIERMLVQRASEPQRYQTGSNWKKVLFTACAVVRKYRKDHKQEEWEMALEADRRDRSYQFGRLLAILEKMERDAYRGETGREPNAVRRMSVYCKRPYHTFVQLEQTVENAYLPHLKPGARVWYKQMIGEILTKMDGMGALGEECRDRPLEDTYLLGYYLQRAELYKGRDKDTDKTAMIEEVEV